MRIKRTISCPFCLLVAQKVAPCQGTVPKGAAIYGKAKKHSAFLFYGHKKTVPPVFTVSTASYDSLIKEIGFISF